MSVTPSWLDNLKVASPCPAAWSGMAGDNQVRFCSKCSLHVYNLSAMTRSEAEAIVQEAEGRLCVRLYRRADGTVLTQDCPLGWRRRALRAWSLTSALVVGCFAVLLGFGDGAPEWRFSLRGHYTMGKVVPRTTAAPAERAEPGQNHVHPPAKKPVR
ncbi:MAG TPA: hypothetical protein VFA18_17060 [Gemmataceae bacterium]|nr:hypothetical protein [Gemmataceae bacterium]